MIEVRSVTKTYMLHGQPVHALRDVSLSIGAGEFVCVVGPSGSGKSTLLHLMGCLDVPTGGEIIFEGLPVSDLSDDERSALRRDKIGFVFQFFNLLPTLTAEENVALPHLIAGRHVSEVRDTVDRVLELVGLRERRHHRPDQLSGGELQRIAIARAMIEDPVVILADEPTGNLDRANGEAVTALLRGVTRAGSCSVVIATHNPELAAAADSVVTLRDGQLDPGSGTRN
jgi:putative ABC transport system ATP-binding protein